MAISVAKDLVILIGEKYITCQQKWEFGGDSIDREIGLIGKRSVRGDHYPQGQDWCVSRMREAKASGKTVTLYAEHTFPFWTWYVYTT